MLWLLRILRSGTSNLIDSGAILRRHIGVAHVSMRSVDNNIFICATSRCASATQKKHQIIYNCTHTYSEFPPALNIFYDAVYFRIFSLQQPVKYKVGQRIVLRKGSHRLAMLLTASIIRPHQNCSFPTNGNNLVWVLFCIRNYDRRTALRFCGLSVTRTSPAIFWLNFFNEKKKLFSRLTM